MRHTRGIHAIGLLAAFTIFVATNATGTSDKSATKLQVPDCGSLQKLAIPASEIGLPTSGAVVQSAELIAETADGNINGEFCKVIGIIKPVNQTSPNIEFEVNLPSSWNRRALQMGGGGYNGILVTGLSFTDMQPENIPTPLKRGFVTLGSDGGHKGAWDFDGSFGLDDEALLNYGKQSIKKVHDAAIHIIQKAYNSAPNHFYFLGGSYGGQEALTAAARYPDDYDGVISHFPAYNVTMLHLGSLNVGRAVYADNGAGWLNMEKTKLIADAVYAACDKLDGAQDGIISNVKGCNTAFDVNKLRCPDGTDTGNTCLSDAQITAARKIASDYKPGFAIAGADTFPRWALFEGSLFQYILGLAPKPGPSDQGPESAVRNGLLFSVGEQTVKYIITRDPSQDALSFDEKQWKDRIATVASIMDVTNVSLERFRAKGGKIILTHGAIDDWITPYNTVTYYERQVKQFGKPVVDSFIRFYMIPGFGHRYGPFDAKFDDLQALQDWVEEGKEPGQLIAIDANPNANRSRPLCPWPAWPKFTGDPGTENNSASYTCVAN